VDDDAWHGRLSFFGRRLPPAFAVRAVRLAPGRAAVFHEAAWRDALVVVERGEIELECASGVRLRCRCGDVLWLTGLSVRALRNPGAEVAVLGAVSRSRPGSDESAARPPSELRASSSDQEIPT
jgi:quercetin dioxygenase-like cupin family protein